MISLLLILAFAGHTAHAADIDDSDANAKACQAVERLSAPAKDMPSKNEAEKLAKCDSAAAFYGIGQAIDYKKARLCAFAQIQNKEEEFWGGPTILYMIYANGQGVVRDTKLALKFACDFDGAHAETEGRIKHLKDFKGTLDFCDDITSGYAQGFCASLAAAKAKAKREVEFTKLSFKGEDFNKLKIAAANFSKARSDNEVDLTGTDRGAMMVSEADIQDRDFLESLQTFEKGKSPKFDFKKENAKMNDAFKKILKTKNPEENWGTVTKDNILTTQKAWIKYRDAWRKFAGPEKADQIDAWFTKKRTHMLNSFLKEN